MFNNYKKYYCEHAYSHNNYDIDQDTVLANKNI